MRHAVTVLETDDLSFTILKDGDDFDLIHKATLHVNPGHFMAIVGPSGCGKSTLLKLIAGINEESGGDIYWQGRNLMEEEDLEPSEIGYVPQFSIAYDHLTVEESVESAARLRVDTETSDEFYELTDRVIEQTGLDSIRQNMVSVISGGQKRRLGLAIELVSNPHLLLCDEVTSGLDPKSEHEIVKLLHWLSKADERRIVINVTHSLSNLELYDSVLVLHQGRIAYHGPPSALSHYFSVGSAEDVYPTLALRGSDEWFQSWNKHRDAYYARFGMSPPEEISAERKRKKAQKLKEQKEAEGEESEEDSKNDSADFHDSLGGSKPTDAVPVVVNKRGDGPPPSPALGPDGLPVPENIPDIPDDLEDHDELEDAPEEEADSSEKDKDSDKKSDESEDDDDDITYTPGFISQFIELFSRRWKIFFRDKVQLILHIAMLVGFPVLVWLFVKDGIGTLDRLDVWGDSNFLADKEDQYKAAQSRLQVGSLISGVIMFQVVLLTLMGANNAAREVAAERLIFEKEKLGGVSPAAYLFSKVAFLAILAGAQALWMASFVDLASGGVLPGSFGTRLLLLLFVNFAVTSVCLGISSLMRSPEQSTLLSIYLVGFQLPLSGAVLALPDGLDSVIHPFIAAYWSWSGSLKTMEDPYYGAVQDVTPENYIVTPETCLFVLGMHIIIGLMVAYFGCKRSRWD